MKPRNSSRLLIDEGALQLQPSLAETIGLNEAIVLQQVHSCIITRTNRDRSTQGWVRGSYPEWQATTFPFWSVDTVKRTFQNLETKALLISRQQDRGFDRSKWYRINYDALNTLLDGSDENSDYDCDVGSGVVGTLYNDLMDDVPSGQNDPVDRNKVPQPTTLKRPNAAKHELWTQDANRTNGATRDKIQRSGNDELVGGKITTPTGAIGGASLARPNLAYDTQTSTTQAASHYEHNMAGRTSGKITAIDQTPKPMTPHQQMIRAYCHVVREVYGPEQTVSNMAQHAKALKQLWNQLKCTPEEFQACYRYHASDSYWANQTRVMPAAIVANNLIAWRRAGKPVDHGKATTKPSMSMEMAPPTDREDEATLFETALQRDAEGRAAMERMRARWSSSVLYSHTDIERNVDAV